MRETVLEMVKKSGQDIVPEVHVVTVGEIGQILEGGEKALGDLKPGSIVEERWRFITKVKRGEVFYVFQRLTAR
jgi:hypothetical protein